MTETSQRITWAIVLLLLLVLPAGATDYYVATTGDDGAAGDIDHPLLTTTHAMTHATAAGDTVYLRAGTYRGQSITFGASGSSGLPITVRNYGTEVVTLEGSNPVSAGSWTKCANADDAHGNTNWAHLYKCNLPAGSRWLNANLFQDSTRLMLAQNAVVADRYWLEDYLGFYQLATEGAVTQTTITDTNLDSYGGADLVAADAYVVVLAIQNTIRCGHITNWDAGTHKITFSSLGVDPYYLNGHYYYSIVNSWTSQVLNNEGEYWVAYDEVTGQRECLVWPWDDDDLSAGVATVTATATAPGINFGTYAYGTVQGLTFNKGYGRCVSTQGNHCQVVNCSFLHWSAIGEESTGGVLYALYAGEGYVGGSYSLFDGVTLTDYVGNAHGIMLGGSAEHTRVTNCVIDYQGGTGIINFSNYVEISRNVVKNCRGPHANGITGAYYHANYALIAHNYVYDSANNCTIQDASNVTVFGNVFDGGTHQPSGYACVEWAGAGDGYWRIINNTLVGVNTGVCLHREGTHWDSVVVMNNFLMDAQFWYENPTTHTHNRYLGAPQYYDLDATESLTTMAAAITNYDTQTYTPVAAGPLDGYGADVSSYLDTAAWPDYDFDVDIAGNPINWSSGVEIGAYQLGSPPPTRHWLLLRKP